MATVPGNTSTLPFRVGRYECRRDLGGNMADVYLAWDDAAARPVVVKLLRAPDAADPMKRQRFVSEARLACRCSHPNIITTYDVGEHEGRPYIAMEWLEGEPLRNIIHRGGFANPADAYAIALQTARALRYLHQLGIVHRDVKPANVQVLPDGQVKLLDFGVARRDDSDLTQAGQILGTLAYMGPEQMVGDKPTRLLDIYSFGVLLFEMLTLRLPYQAETQQEIAAAILYNPPDLTALQERGIAEPIVRLIQRCLEKDAGKRFPDFQPIIDVLKSFAGAGGADQTAVSQLSDAGLTTEAPRAQSAQGSQSAPGAGWRWIAIAVAGVLILGVAGGVYVWMRRQQPLAPAILTSTGAMVLVQGGPAKLGGDNTVTAVAAFYIDRTEVANREYRRFCRATHRQEPAGLAEGQADLPAVNVTFGDAKAFAAWAHKRLPTAMEWEKAARGGNGQKFPWGDEFRSDAANLLPERGAQGHLMPVASHLESASPCGALNMLGNVWEWVDTAASAPPASEFGGLPRLDPPLSASEPWYQIRGGSYAVHPADGPEAARFLWDVTPFPARASANDIGFRCAIDADKAVMRE